MHACIHVGERVASPRAAETIYYKSGAIIAWYSYMAVEGKRCSYARAQHFMRPNPLRKEAISRTTKYRVLKRRKIENSNSVPPCAETDSYTHDVHNNAVQDDVANSCSGNSGLTAPLNQSLSANLVDSGQGAPRSNRSITFDHEEDLSNLENPMVNTRSIEFNLEFNDDYYVYEPLTELLPAEDVSNRNGDHLDLSAEDSSDSDNAIVTYAMSTRYPKTMHATYC